MSVHIYQQHIYALTQDISADDSHFGSRIVFGGLTALSPKRARKSSSHRPLLTEFIRTAHSVWDVDGSAGKFSRNDRIDWRATDFWLTATPSSQSRAMQSTFRRVWAFCSLRRSLPGTYMSARRGVCFWLWSNRC